MSFTVLFFQFDSWLETKNVVPIGGFLSLMIGGAAIQDCSTDGWILSKLHPSNIQLAGPIQSCGIKTGILFGFAIFAELERAYPDFITIQRWFLLIASGLLVLCFVVYFCIDETRVKDEDEHVKTDYNLPEAEELTLEETMGSWTVLKNVFRNNFQQYYSKILNLFALKVF